MGVEGGILGSGFEVIHSSCNSVLLTNNYTPLIYISIVQFNIKYVIDKISLLLMAEIETVGKKCFTKHN